MKRLILTLSLLFGAAAFAQPTVITSIHPIYDLTRQVAGERAEVVRVLPPGMSPHTFDPTPRDVARIAEADLVIMVGGYGIDSWLQGLVEASGSSAPVLELFEALEFDAIETEHDHDHGDEHEHDDHHDDEHEHDEHHDDEHEHDEHHDDEHEHDEHHDDEHHDDEHHDDEHEHDEHHDDERHDDEHHDDEHHDDEHHDDEHHDDEHEHDAHREDEHGHEEGHDDGHEHGDEHAHDHGPVNSHLWLDPLLMTEAVTLIAEALTELDAEGAETYQANAERLIAELEALDAELREMLAPLAGEAFVPFHDAWPYFAERYGLDLVVEIEPFPGREPSPAYLQYALGEIEGSGARAIFTEPQLSRRPAEVVAESAGLPLFEMDPLGGTAETESYQDLLRHNARVLIEALGQDD